MAPHRRARLGLVRTFQAVELFDDLTVRDNLRAAANRRTWWQSLGDLVAPRWHDDESAIDDALELLGLTDVADELPPELPQGQAQARRRRTRARLPSSACCCSTSPPPGSTPSESVELGARLRAVVDSGVTVLLVDHDMGLVLGIVRPRGRPRLRHG